MWRKEGECLHRLWHGQMPQTDEPSWSLRDGKCATRPWEAALSLGRSKDGFMIANLSRSRKHSRHPWRAGLKQRILGHRLASRPVEDAMVPVKLSLQHALSAIVSEVTLAMHRPRRLTIHLVDPCPAGPAKNAARLASTPMATTMCATRRDTRARV